MTLLVLYPIIALHIELLIVSLSGQSCLLKSTRLDRAVAKNFFSTEMKESSESEACIAESGGGGS